MLESNDVGFSRAPARLNQTKIGQVGGGGVSAMRRRGSGSPATQGLDWMQTGSGASGGVSILFV